MCAAQECSSSARGPAASPAHARGPGARQAGPRPARRSAQQQAPVLPSRSHPSATRSKGAAVDRPENDGGAVPGESEGTPHDHLILPHRLVKVAWPAVSSNYGGDMSSGSTGRRTAACGGSSPAPTRKRSAQHDASSSDTGRC
jgi:hypothetical protein